MTKDEAIKLLSKNGKLIKRPFLLTNNNGTVGFKEETWKKLL
jgi:arsenate reductase-like glutaredoxin family protein